MRYKTGSKVEVLSENEVPSGSWRCAEIICGNGHNYSVKYETDPGATDEAIVERVSRKSIRPCPPPAELPGNWVPGDVVEVFHNFSWKMATVSKILGRHYFLVRLLGSSSEYKLSKFDLRVRQSWQDDKWFVIGKGTSNCEDGKHGERSTLKYNHKLSSQVKKRGAGKNFHVKGEHCTAKNNANFQELHIVSSRTLKRGLPSCYSQVEAPARTAGKFRVIEKESRRHRLLTANPLPLPEKVDAVAYNQEILGETHICTSFNNKTTHFTEVHVEREKPSGAVGCSRAISLEPNDADNATCSLGSCSISSNNPFKFCCNFSRGPVEDTEGNFSDAESVYRWGYEDGNCFLPTQEELAAEIHTLELHAYRCTMEALHASAEAKPKVEDGIFGTSGGIGFTKKNELFVGRVAMIGFAASLLGEAITGKGILAQLNLETGIPIYEAEPLLLFFILFTLLGAIGALGDRGRFVDDPSGLERAVIPPGKGFRSALGLKEGGPLFGFTKANELFVGRLAQLGIAFSLIGEIITGKGALAQLNIETGVPISEIEPLLLFNVAFFFFAALNPGTGKFVTDDEED